MNVSKVSVPVPGGHSAKNARRAGSTFTDHQTSKEDSMVVTDYTGHTPADEVTFRIPREVLERAEAAKAAF